MSSSSLPTLSADLLLLHAPAFFDFRQRRDIYFPFLSTSGDVPITPLYEYFPVGFKSLQRYLGERDHDVKLINLSTLLLRYPHIDFRSSVTALDVKLLGIDLHWMVHVQGSLAVAEAIKKERPDIPIIFGGISSTYYGEELIRYPFIDMVMRGYDTHAPMAMLLSALRQGTSLSNVLNLLWKSADGRIHDNDLHYKPTSFACGVDWTQQPQSPGQLQSVPIRELLSVQNAGCSYNCGWCGGSREAFRRVFKSTRATIYKTREEVDYEFEAMKNLPGIEQHHVYSIGSYNNPPAVMASFINHVADSSFRSINYEQYHLTRDDVLPEMARANKRTTITLSPESHDLHIARLSGRGVYTNEQMEAWLERALGYGIYQVHIWYFIGMPEQDERSVMDTVEYCHHLLKKFPNGQVQPFLCPMIPFLDPASTFFEQPDKHGYRVFYRSVEEHRRGMERASLINRINYETQWLSRRDLVHVGFTAVRHLMEIKAAIGLLPKSVIKNYTENICDALYFIDVVDEVDNITDPQARARELDRLGDEIERRNNKIFFDGVSNQAMPINRQIGGRWFDELGWRAEELEAQP